MEGFGGLLSRSLSGRLALLTGAGRGIGRATALALAQEGAELVLSARSRDELDETAAACRDAGAKAHVVQADLASTQDVHRLADAALAIHGHVDVLVNNAGVYGPIGPFQELDLDAWERAHRVNLFSPFLLTQRIAPSMIARRRGKIVFLAGGGATQPLPHISAYASSKAAVVRLAETLAHELRPHHVQVNAVSPGLVDTKLQDDLLDAGERGGPLRAKIAAAREQGVGKVGPEVAAGLIAFLASDASGELTGKLIAAPWDPWREWGARGAALSDSALYTLRRLDPNTIRQVLPEVA